MIRIISKAKNGDEICHLTFDKSPSRLVQRTGTTF